MERKWWHHSVVYQIYPRSFMDSNGDGIGDLKGITQKLDYLQELGVDMLWLCPVYGSPNDDNGYDVSDYYSIMKEFGSMEDMDCLIEQAKQRNIGIMMDMVLNHSSDEHQWFVEARKSKNNPYRDYYIWTTNPNELASLFSGSAWQYEEETKEYYLHFFSKKQPDLNWTNEKVRKGFADVILYWMDKGIQGFRFDVIEMIGKEPFNNIVNNGPKLHDYIQELNQNSFGQKDLMTVGECWCADEQIASQYSNPKNHELSMVFQFQHVTLGQKEDKWHPCEVDFMKLKEIFSGWETAFNEQNPGWNSLFWNNHDLPRVVSKFGNDQEYRVESAKMLATLLHGMQGTPYIYQGEELGMTNVQFKSIDEYRDIELLNMYKEQIGKRSEEELMDAIYVSARDNARTPMQWDDSRNAGFTTGIPWIGINENYKTINAKAAMADQDSIFYYYKSLIELRKKNDIIVYGDYELLQPEHQSVFAYKRTYQGKTILVICNFYGEQTEIDLQEQSGCYKVLIGNYKRQEEDVTIENQIVLKPYEAMMIER